MLSQTYHTLFVTESSRLLYHAGSDIEQHGVEQTKSYATHWPHSTLVLFNLSATFALPISLLSISLWISYCQSRRFNTRTRHKLKSRFQKAPHPIINQLDHRRLDQPHQAKPILVYVYSRFSTSYTHSKQQSLPTTILIKLSLHAFVAAPVCLPTIAAQHSATQWEEYLMELIPLKSLLIHWWSRFCPAQSINWIPMIHEVPRNSRLDYTLITTDMIKTWSRHSHQSVNFISWDLQNLWRGLLIIQSVDFCCRPQFDFVFQPL